MSIQADPLHHEDKLVEGDFVEHIHKHDQGPILESTEDVEPELHWRTWLVLFAGCFCWMGINWGVSATGFWSSYTVGDIGGASIGLWYGEGYLVSQVAISPFFGMVSDFSAPARKYCTIFLLTVASIGCFVIASAKSMYPQAIAGIALYGCGLVAYGPIAAIISDVFPRRMRGLMAGFLYASISIGGFMADVPGGAFIKHGGPGAWRFNLWMSGGLMLIGAALMFLCYKPLPHVPQPGDLTFTQQMFHFDWIGAGLWMVGILPLFLALIWGGNTYAWSSGPCIACLTIAAVGIVSFIVYEWRIKKNGIGNHLLFQNRNFAIAVLAIFIEGIVYITLNIFLGQQIGTLFVQDPVLLGLHFGVILITSSCASIGFGYYSKRFQEIRLPLVASFLTFAAVAAGFSQLTPNTPKAVPWLLCAIIGLGFGAPQGLLITTAQLAVSPKVVGLATSHVIALRSLGGATGAAIATAIFTPKITALLPAKTAEYASKAGVPADQIIAVVTAVLKATAAAPASVPGITAAQIQAAQAGSLAGSAAAYAYIYYSIIPWAVAAAIALCFLRSVKSSMSWNIDRPVETAQQLHVSNVGGSDVAYEASRV